MKLSRDLQRDILRRAGLASPPAKRTRTRRQSPIPAIPADGLLLAFDPSSTATGFAVLSGVGKLIDFGVIKPPLARTLADRSSYTANIAAGLCQRYAPALVAMEFGSGMNYRPERASSLPAMAFCQGCLYRALVETAGTSAVVMIDERVWTNRAAKANRANVVRNRFPEYARHADAGKDRGLDIADALGIGLWTLGNQERT